MESNRYQYNLSYTVTGEVRVFVRRRTLMNVSSFVLISCFLVFASISMTPKFPFIGHDDVFIGYDVISQSFPLKINSNSPTASLTNSQSTSPTTSNLQPSVTFTHLVLFLTYMIQFQYFVVFGLRTGRTVSTSLFRCG